MKKQASPAAQTTTRPDVYQIVTDRVIAALEAGQIAWRKPWHAAYGRPRNYVSGRAYTGINAFLLHLVGGTPFFLTFRQAKELGGNIRKGAKGMPVIYYNVTTRTDKQTGEEEKTPFIKYFTVFSVDDVEGVDIILPEQPQDRAHEPLAAAEALVAGWATCPRIEHGGAQAYYAPGPDFVQVPRPETFTSGEAYYSTLFHELTHATGHASRLDRPDLAEALRPSGRAGYAREELTAEMGAAFLCGHAGLNPSATLENTAAYLQFWLEQLRGDKKLVVQAASRAQRAAEFILGTSGGDDNEPSGPQPTPPSGSPGAVMVVNEDEEAPAAPAVDAGALVPRPALPGLPLVVLGQETLPTLTTVVVSTQRIELSRLMEHPAFTDEQRSIATGRILAEADPARLGCWLTNIMRQIAEWEERTLADEARQNPHFFASAQAPGEYI
ncbi:ArdC family protein [Hymenobacter psychrotolerans]|uniref:Antirestriction protein ArdC n=1 Tax=Hymenobacter psychrotolerans DSM 18569 TaxID=1121959 RepID=A0A1M7G1L3_9BACT|nr:zincin-like metallopeptidase domain-containing protein [Hymenobacter psychrotolerans]SHM10153.1 Antirestriction protein ArdC [Hymenobacter psychrotolerans DSM 18569]